MRGFDVQNGTAITASLDYRPSRRYTATDGLLKFSYSFKPKVCSINIIIPVAERYKMVNVFACLLRVWFSHKIKFTSTTTKFLSDENFISFDIHFNIFLLVKGSLMNSEKPIS